MSSTSKLWFGKSIARMAILLISIPSLVVIWAAFSFAERELFFKFLIILDAILIVFLMSIYIHFHKESDRWSVSKKRISFIIVLVLGFLLYTSSYELLPVQVRYRKEIKTCERIVARIEAYRAKNGHLPAENDRTMFDNEAILLDESSPYRYSNFTNNGITVHTVSFIRGFDDHCDYDLDKKKWDFSSCESM